MTTDVPQIPLRDGNQIPQVGFGVWQVPDGEVTPAVRVALETGYRHIDTAAAYKNEEGVGRAIAEAGVPREQLFVTTKCWNTDHGTDKPRAALEASLRKLGLDYVDLYLIHWPCPDNDLYVQTWAALLQLREEGRARSVGVCNFNVDHLERAHEATGEYPVINQIEIHPYLQQPDLVAFNTEHGIVTEDWSPLASGKGVMDDPTIVDMARELGRTPAQVILRWHIQRDAVVLPKSVTPERIRSNFELFDFALSDEQMLTISTLDRATRTGPDPATFHWMG